MTYKPKYGVAIGVSKRESLDNVADFAAEAESLGLNSVWLQDKPLTTRDPYMALEVVARRTDRILLGPGVSTPATRHPAVIANSIITLNDESDGRAFLGLGSGGPSLLQPLGIESRRAKAFRQEMEQIVTLLRGDEVITDGRHYRVGRSASSIPVISAASGDMMLRASGAVADGVLLAGPAIIDRYREHTSKARSAATTAGRQPDDVGIHILLNVAIDNEETRGVDQAKPFVAAWIHADQVVAGESVAVEFAGAIAAVKERHDPSRHLASGPDADAVPDELVRAVAVAGSRDECQRQLLEILKLEPEQVVFTVPARDRLSNLRAIASIIESANVR